MDVSRSAFTPCLCSCANIKTHRESLALYEGGRGGGKHLVISRKYVEKAHKKHIHDDDDVSLTSCSFIIVHFTTRG